MVEVKTALIASGLSALAVEGSYWLVSTFSDNKYIVGAVIFITTFTIGFLGMIWGN